MVKYWCKYVDVDKDENNCLEAGYGTLVGLITDLLEDITNKESTTIKYVLREQHGTEFTLNKADYTN